MPTKDELRILQAYPLEMKVRRTQQRIREWVNYYGVENCAVSFSGGKDSTVLLHIARTLYPNIEAVFVNTGLEVYVGNDGEQYDTTLSGCGGKLCTTGCRRTGCVFCGFGAHRDKGESRFQRLKQTHSKLYDYCMNGGQYDSEGYWQPSINGLGMAHCIDELNRLYGKDFIRY